MDACLMAAFIHVLQVDGITFGPEIWVDFPLVPDWRECIRESESRRKL